MATRATIYVDGIDTVKVYKHWDGYPEATLPWLEDFNKSFTEGRGFDDPQYKFAQLLRSSITDADKYGLNDAQHKFAELLRSSMRDADKHGLDPAHLTGWGVVPITQDCGAEHEYHLLADGTVKHLPVERHYE